jgi:putative phosphoesterase
MRIAVVSDIHGNRTAFEAVLADLRQTSPDLILHGGDLADGGSSAAEIVDQIRDLGWPGVLGNTDELMFNPASLPRPFALVEEIAAASREALGEARIAWLRDLPMMRVEGSMALVHASPESCWRSPMVEASDVELEVVYSPLGMPIVVYGHIHRPFIRDVGGMSIVNTGSVSLSFDGDPRASYLLLDVLDEVNPQIRRVDYDVEAEIKILRDRRIPHADWIAKILASASL